MEQDLPISLQPKQYRLKDAIQDRRPDAPTVLGFGGSRGAAKSGAVRRIALILAMEQPGIIIWIIRRVWDDLNKDHVIPLFEEYPDLKPFYRAGNKEPRLLHENGRTSSIFFIHAGDTGRAKRKSRGPQAHYIFLEQAEEFSQEEMEQLAGSNRAPGVAPGFCKRIFTFNPGGIGTTYLRRIFHMKEYRDNENAGDFLFIQGFGWDNYEWFRGLDIVSEWDFYNSPGWDEQRRFDVFINRTDFGRRWRRWIATDWGFSHYAATGWFTSGLLSPDLVLDLFGVVCGAPVRVVILYRELVCCDVPEPDLARVILAMTPPAERREVRDHWIGHDAWAKRGSANTVVEQMEPILNRGGLPYLSRADIDRVGGWRLMYNAWASARRLRKWPVERGRFTEEQSDPPAFFVSAACPEVIQAIPMLICKDEDPKDVRKLPGAVADDVADMCRYGLKSYLAAEPTGPKEVLAAATYEQYQDPTARAMAMLRLSARQQQGQYIRRRKKL